MNTQDAIQTRKSVRAYLDKEITDEQINQLLSLASCSPSGANTQPWQVAVVRGETKLKMQRGFEQAFASDKKVEKDYQYYPIEWIEPFKQRRVDCGQQLYNALDIKREDRDRRREQWARNYRAFDAPVLLMFFLDGSLEAGSYIDTGMFLQTLMIAAVDMGLATCPEAALAEYPDVVRDALGMPRGTKVICGMALGYEDAGQAVNQYRTPRAEPSTFTTWFD
jgi:nitroreductase